jgi:hypothetical protein
MGQDGVVEVVFKKLGHFWFDAGLVGLIKMLEEVNLKKLGVTSEVIDNQLRLNGESRDIQKAIESAYERLVEKYYNLSSQKQREDTASYNFYYDTQNDCFVSFPKRKAVGIAGIICDTAPRPTGGSIKWHQAEKGVLPQEYIHLQEKLDLYLKQSGLKITTSGLLIDGPNAIKPSITIKLDKSKKSEQCYLCGEEGNALEEANQTIFPFITGNSGVLSFNSEIGKPEKICWKCSLLGKFVPVTGFYSAQGEHLYAFLPYSTSLAKMCSAEDLLRDSRYEDPNLYRNFNPPLGGYFQNPFEMTFAFLYTLYDKMLMHQKEDSNEGEIELEMEVMLNLTFNMAPLEFFVIHTKDEGNTFAGKMIWPFKETIYFFRLIQEIEKKTKVRMEKILPDLIDYEQKNEARTLLRNKVCERMLKKQTILDLIEKHIYHSGINYFKPLFEMLLVYELIIREGDLVFKEEQDAAVALGRCIGMALGKSIVGKKGDLFALRKSRRKVDFLEQLNRLQFRLGNDFIVPKDVYEGKLTDENFQEFKQFCMIAALNSYNYAKSENHSK